MTLHKKVVAITGASRGLGKELATQLVHLGAHVILIARNESLLVSHAQSLHAIRPKSATYEVCDIADTSAVLQTAKNIFRKHERVDIVVNNAGIWTDNDIERDRPDMRRRAFEVNALGNIQFTYAMLEFLQKQSTPSKIVNIVSTAGTDYDRGGGWTTYKATKWAMRGFAKSLRYQLQESCGSKITVSDFFPAGIDTDLYETSGRPDAHGQNWMMRVKDVAECIVFMMSRPDDMNIEELIVTKVIR
jgi:NADP-dependent 3-hydroxy acid dehydrogenase YdfG